MFVGIAILGCLQRARYEMLLKSHNTACDVAMVQKQGTESWCSSMEMPTRKTLRSCAPMCKLGVAPVALVREEIL